ncbi:unnamed protein product, partial [Symbiodinium sp. CCMP2456]
LRLSHGNYRSQGLMLCCIQLPSALGNEVWVTSTWRLTRRGISSDVTPTSLSTSGAPPARSRALRRQHFT